MVPATKYMGRFGEASLQARRLILAVMGAVALVTFCLPGLAADFREPVTLASKDGVLEVRLTARQGAGHPRHGGRPVQNFLLFDYELIRGTASNGKMSGGNLYPAPTLQVFPGETLIVHLDNALTGSDHPGLSSTRNTPPRASPSRSIPSR